MKLNFSHNHLLITGANSELGIAIAKEALENSLNLTLSVRSEKAQTALIKLFPKEIGDGRVEIATLNLNKPDRFTQLDWKNYNYICDLAQPDHESLIASSNEKENDDYFNATITNRATLLKNAIRGMLSSKFGRLIFISSTATDLINPGQGFYAASKAASEKLYQATGIEMGAKGITTAILRPGYIESGRGKGFLTKDKTKGRIPTARALNCEEIAKTTIFLLSDSALQINGSIITMDGGMSQTK